MQLTDELANLDFADFVCFAAQSGRAVHAPKRSAEVGYWLWFDHALHATNRSNYMRTGILIVTPVLGLLAIAKTFDEELWPPLLLKSSCIVGLLRAGTGRSAT